MLQQRKCGEKTELTAEERSYLEKELNGQFTIHNQIGRTGAHSAAFALTDKKGTPFVLRIAVNPQDKSWAFNQAKGNTAKSYATKGYTGRVFIPQPVLMGFNYIVEPYAGTELLPHVYDNLSEAEKNKIAYDIAEFLNFIHQKEPNVKTVPMGIGARYSRVPAEQLEIFFQTVQTPQEQQEWAQMVSAFEHRDTSDEITTFIHNDVRGQNILYNPLTQRVAFIDFEAARLGNVYRDFAPPAAFAASHDMLFRVIEHYNQMPKKFPIYINPQKVALMHKVAKFYEYAGCGILRNIAPGNQNDRLKGLVQTVNAAFRERVKS